MDIRYLKTLVTVVEVGSFSKAARALHLTQSAVSQRIKFLEEAYNYSLFDRSAPSLTLTSSGEMVLESAKQILGIQDSLMEKLKRIKDRPRVSLCCTPTFGTVYLPGVLNRFMLESGSPVDLKFLLHSPDQALEGIQNKEFDLAIVEHCAGDNLGRFQTYSLPQDELVFVSSPKLNLPTPNLDLETLLDLCLFARKEGCSSRQLITRGLQEQGRSLDDFSGVITSDDLRLTCQTVLSGGGISFMSRSLVCEYLKTGQMVEHYVEGFPHARCRTVIIEKGRENEPLLRSFARCIFKVMDVPSPI
ncbi:transcriptional regulator, LysR family [Desulfuromusa kysingii]|uniref:Transcriptional regulator, LysR family n=1 Tax=Desulfuromusa kysingii TaxID=37625 RepID=A0A1H3WAD8_9BACT|nr:LysR family transcriptional regulator [Desulfuromusa kysingii]SDZ84083.1 transcriptional regulator, LysR family [Desulfuromusa kysingii]